MKRLKEIAAKVTSSFGDSYLVSEGPSEADVVDYPFPQVQTVQPKPTRWGMARSRSKLSELPDLEPVVKTGDGYIILHLGTDLWRRLRENLSPEELQCILVALSARLARECHEASLEARVARERYEAERRRALIK